MAGLRSGQLPWRRDAHSTDSTEIGAGFNRFAPGRMGGAFPAPGMTASCRPAALSIASQGACRSPRPSRRKPTGPFAGADLLVARLLRAAESQPQAFVAAGKACNAGGRRQSPLPGGRGRRGKEAAPGRRTGGTAAKAASAAGPRGCPPPRRDSPAACRWRCGRRRRGRRRGVWRSFAGSVRPPPTARMASTFQRGIMARSRTRSFGASPRVSPNSWPDFKTDNYYLDTFRRAGRRPFRICGGKRACRAADDASVSAGAA